MSIFFFSEFKECFNLFDGDSDGMVTEKELGLIMRSLGENITHFEIEELMTKAGKFTSPYWRQFPIIWKSNFTFISACDRVG